MSYDYDPDANYTERRARAHYLRPFHEAEKAAYDRYCAVVDRCEAAGSWEAYQPQLNAALVEWEQAQTNLELAQQAYDHQDVLPVLGGSSLFAHANSVALRPAAVTTLGD